MMMRLRDVVLVGVLAAGAGQLNPVMAASEGDSGDSELVLPVRKSSAGEEPSAAAAEEPMLAIPVPKGASSGQSKPMPDPDPALAPPPEPVRRNDPPSSRSARTSEKNAAPARAAATPKKTADNRPSEKKTAEKKTTESRRETARQPERKSSERTAATRAAASERTTQERRTASASSRVSEPGRSPASLPAPGRDSRRPVTGDEGDITVPENLDSELAGLPPLSVEARSDSELDAGEAPEAAPAPRPERRRGLLSRAWSTIWPGRGKPETAPAVFNTDYRTRPANAVIPAAISGNGLGGRDLPIGGEDAFRRNLPPEFAPTDLVRVDPELCLSDGQPIFLRREAAAALERMFRDAEDEGLKLRVFSGYRDYAHQARLYEEAVRRSGPGQTSVARPGRSEHFLGTTADVTNGQPRHLLSRSFAASPEGRWLEKNAARYGWKMTVRAEGGGGSHEDEPWHIRYVGPAAAQNTEPVIARGRQSEPAPAPNRPGIVRRLGRLVGIGR